MTKGSGGQDLHANDKVSYEKPNDPGFEIVPNEVDPEEDKIMTIDFKKPARNEKVEEDEKMEEPESDKADDKTDEKTDDKEPEKAKEIPTIEKKVKTHRGHRDVNVNEALPPKEKPEQAVVVDAAEPENQRADVFSGDTFADLPINDKLKIALEQNSFTELTGIQKRAIPAIIADKNVIMKSETGSGKTLAYLVPLIEKLSVHSMAVEKIRREYGTYCIIFSPTRELCAQIEIELLRLTSKMFAYMICSTIMGGENPKKEKARLRKGITILVCTPGRFLYHLQNTENIGLSRLQYMIIDEADRMLDMGFEREMNQCLS